MKRFIFIQVPQVKRKLLPKRDSAQARFDPTASISSQDSRSLSLKNATPSWLRGECLQSIKFIINLFWIWAFCSIEVLTFFSHSTRLFLPFFFTHYWQKDLIRPSHQDQLLSLNSAVLGREAPFFSERMG